MWLPQSIDHSRQRWLFILRLLSTTFLALAITLLYLNGRGPVIFSFWSPSIAVVLALSYALAFFHYYALPRLLETGPQIVTQMFCDTVISSTVIILSGGFDSTLNFVFLVVVINSAFLGGLRISFIAATLSSVAWAAILDLHYYGYLPGLPPLGVYMGSTELALNILVNTGANYLVAVLSVHLSTQLDLSSRALVSSQTSLDRLSELNDNIIRSIDSGLVTTDDQGLVLSINPAGRELLKVSHDVFGTHWRLLFPELGPPGEGGQGLGSLDWDGQDFGSLLGRPGQGKQGLGRLDLGKHGFGQGEAPMGARSLRLRHVRQADRAELDLELTALALKDIRNEGWGHLLVIKDQTAMNQMESEIKRSEHMAAVGQLAAGLAHEIRTPLASMSGSWHMILSQSLKSEDQSRLMNIIGREMDRLEGLVDDFLSFAKPPTGNPQPLDLNAIIEDQVHVFSSWKGDEADIEIHLNDVPKVLFDSGQLSQVIFNLVQNAMEATVPGQRPHVVVETYPDPARPNFVAMAIADEGTGISEKDIRRVFEPFYTTKAKGHGLGLAMVWSIVARGNGHISVRSTPNKLTTFTVLIPKAPEPAKD
jgi:two-component system sensor histidine kinase PilS (NtrC family)